MISGCVRHLEQLDPEIVPATFACCETLSDRGTLEHLRLLKKEWTANVELLVATLDDVIDLEVFVHISGECKWPTGNLQFVEYKQRK